MTEVHDTPALRRAHREAAYAKKNRTVARSVISQSSDWPFSVALSGFVNFEIVFARNCDVRALNHFLPNHASIIFLRNALFYSSAPLMPNKPEAELTLEEELKHIEAARMEAEFEELERRSREFFERLEKPPVRLVAAFCYAEGI